MLAGDIQTQRQTDVCVREQVLVNMLRLTLGASQGTLAAPAPDQHLAREQMRASVTGSWCQDSRRDMSAPRSGSGLSC